MTVPTVGDLDDETLTGLKQVGRGVAVRESGCGSVRGALTVLDTDLVLR